MQSGLRAALAVAESLRPVVSVHVVPANALPAFKVSYQMSHAGTLSPAPAVVGVAAPSAGAMAAADDTTDDQDEDQNNDQSPPDDDNDGDDDGNVGGNGPQGS